MQNNMRHFRLLGFLGTLLPFCFIVKFPGIVRRLSDFRIGSSTLMYNRQTTRKGVMIGLEDGATYCYQFGNSYALEGRTLCTQRIFWFIIPEV